MLWQTYRRRLLLLIVAAYHLLWSQHTTLGQLQMRLKRFKRYFGFGRKRLEPADFAKLGSDAWQVIAERTAQGMTGTLSAAEAHRMGGGEAICRHQSIFRFR